MKTTIAFFLLILTAAASGPAPKWEYGTTADGMGRERWNARLYSANTVNFSFPYSGEQHAKLVVRANKTEITDILFAIEKGQIISDAIAVRFDEGPIRRFSITGASDHSSTAKFIDNVQGFLNGLRKAKRVRIEATIFQQGNQTFEFNAAGFEW